MENEFLCHRMQQKLKEFMVMRAVVIKYLKLVLILKRLVQNKTILILKRHF